MRKTRKLGVAIASLLAAVLLAFAPAVVKAYDAPELKGYTPQRVELSAQRSALNGWQWYFNDSLRGMYYDSNDVVVSATTAGHGGNQAIVIDRKKDDGMEAVFYSYNFDVTAGTQYQINYWVKFEGAANAGRMAFTVVDGGNVSYDTVNFDEVGTWKQITFNHTASNAKIGLKFSAGGIGKFTVSDITVKEVIGHENRNLFALQAIGNNGTESHTNMSFITNTNLSTDSSDGDGYSLKVNQNDVYRTLFGMLPHGGTYTLSFKFKLLALGTTYWDDTKNLKTTISVRLDNVTTDGARAWYATSPVVDTNNTTTWQTYSYTFTAVSGQTDIVWMGLMFYGTYLIDELQIIGTDTNGAQMNYIPNGSFSGAYLDGFTTVAGNFNTVKQPDGSYTFVGTSKNQDIIPGIDSRPYMQFGFGLNAGEEYTLSFDYRSGGANAIDIFYGTGWGGAHPYTNIKTCGQATSPEWRSESVTFNAYNDSRIELYGDAGCGWPTYIKNIKLIGADGVDLINNTTLVNPGVTYGANVFPYGTFAGDTTVTTDGWTLASGAEIQGFTFEDTKTCYEIVLIGTEEAPAVATSAPVAVTADVIKVSYKTECGNENVKVSLIANGTEIMPVGDTVFTQESGKPLGVGANVSGRFTLPEGTTSVQVVFKGTGYTSLKYVDLQCHVHGETCSLEGTGNPTYVWSADNKTCTATVGACKVCGRLPDNPVTETVNAVITEDTATYFAKGTGTYTATFANTELFASQTKQGEETSVKTLPVTTYAKVSARVSAPYGLRWSAGINKTLWQEITAYEGVTAEAGMLIAPYDYVTAAGEFTMDALTEKGLNFKAVDFGGGFNEALTADKNDDNNCWYGALVNIQNANLDREFAGRAYVKLTDGENTVIHYGNFSYEDQVRTFEYICKSVVADDNVTDQTIKAFAKEQLDKIVNVVYENGVATIVDAEGYATPYAVTAADGVINITLANAEAGNLVNVAKIKVNGKSCEFTLTGNTITVTLGE